MNEIPPPIFQTYAPQPPRPKRRTGYLVYSVVVSFFLGLSILANFVLFAIAMGKFDTGDSFDVGQTRYEESFLQGDTGAKTKIAVIYLTGVISSVEDGYATEDGMVGLIKDQLQQARDDKHVKAIILRINSPGGEVVASDEIYQAVAAAREEKPVIASMDTVAASGGFYAAMGASHIVANELTLTGSIGVILQTFTFGGLMDKVGVRSYTFKSGLYKDILNPTREPTAAESVLVSNLIMEVYDKFVGVVAEERKMKEADLRNGLADGRILSGKQALKAGFVDELGYFDDAVNAAKEFAKIGKTEKVKVVRYSQRFSLRNLLRLVAQNDRAKIQIQVSPSSLKLETGKLYFLPAYMFQ